jgi:uncharacterized membrane protein
MSEPQYDDTAAHDIEMRIVELEAAVVDLADKLDELQMELNERDTRLRVYLENRDARLRKETAELFGTLRDEVSRALLVRISDK